MYEGVGVTAMMAGRAARWSEQRTGEVKDTPLAKAAQLRARQMEAEKASVARMWRDVAKEAQRYL